METRFRHDFTRVQVHDDAEADASSRRIGARAFTVGDHIVFGAGQFAPATEHGQRLLVHELTHVVQQVDAGQRPMADGRDHTSPLDLVEREADAAALSASAAPMAIRGRLGRWRVARQALDRYETKGIEITGGDIAKLAGTSYWVNKVGDTYRLLFSQEVQNRFKASAEERDAVLSVLWSVRPVKLTTQAVSQVEIPPRPGNPKSAPLIYEFTFTPKSKPAEKDTVQVAFKAEGKAAVVTTTGPAPAGYKPPYLSMDSEGFPQGRDEYWKQHPKEQAQLYHWIESLPDGSVDQIVTAKETATARKKTTHTSSYRVKGDKKGGKLVSGFSVDYLGAAPTVREAAAGYAKKDSADQLLEKAQSAAGGKKDTLGKVNGLDKLPPEEQLSVKYAVWQYFEGRTRNAEVDVVLPVGETERTVLYTLRFRAGGDVDIERVGEKGGGVGQFDPTNLDIRSVHGFGANSKDPATLLAWLKRRYKAVSPTGKTVEAICNSFNATLRVQAGSPEWFKDNYGIHVLAASDGENRLQKEHGVPSDLSTDITNFTPAELKLVEITLEGFSGDLLGLVSGTRMVRKGMGIRFDEKTKSYVEDETEAGLTLRKDGTRTILIFDRATKSDLVLFVGGRAGVRPHSMTTVAHEFGHVIEASSGIKKAFYHRFGKVKPPTWYAAQRPKEELFTEMFALYRADPEWLRANRLEVFDWFEKLSQDGKPPP